MQKKEKESFLLIEIFHNDRSLEKKKKYLNNKIIEIGNQLNIYCSIT